MKSPGNSNSFNKSQQNKPNLCNKYKRYEQSMMVQATALIVDNIGFSSASNSVINILSYLLRTYFEKLCRESTSLAEFVGRDFVTLEDVSTMFLQNSIDLRDLHDYLQQVGSFQLTEQPPLFPLPLSYYKKIVETQELVKQKEDEATEKTDINEKIHVNDDDNEQQDDIKQDHRGVQRFAQKSFPNFLGACAPDLGITIKKFVPPLVEIIMEANLVKSTITKDVSFSIIRQDFFSVPCLSLKGVPESERHKEKKRRKKERREHHRESNELNEGKRQQLEKVHEMEGTQADAAKSPDHLKVPKIKIRIGPGPSSTVPLFEPQSIQQPITIGLSSPINEPKIIPTQFSTKIELPQPSTSKATTTDKLKTIKCLSPDQEIIFIDERPQTTTIAAKTPPSREETIKGAKKRKRSPKRALPSVVEPTITESVIPAITQGHSSSITDISLKKDEAAKMPDIEKNKRKRKSPKRTSPSPPRRCIRASTPKKEEVEKLPIDVTPLQNNVKKVISLLPPKLSAETKSVPSVSTDLIISNILQKQTSTMLKQSKRSRKSEKPTRVDPSIVSEILTAEASPPPGPSPAPSKAMETVLETSKKKEKSLETNKKMYKTTDTSMKIPQTSMKKPPIKLSKLLKSSTVSTPQNETKTPCSGSTSKSKINEKITPALNKSKPKTQKTSTKTAEKKKEVITKIEEKFDEIKEVIKSSSTETNFDDDQEEDVWICPVCSVAYVENGPDMVACDTCDRWFHWSCVGILIPPPDNASWFCNECKKKNKKNSGINSGGNTSRKSSFGGTSNKKRVK